MAKQDALPLPVVNASPLIFLSKSGYLDFLRLVNEQVLVPEPVVREILRRGPDDATARALDEADWLRLTPVSSIPPIIQAWDLGPGESAVLALATERPGTEAIIDDLAGRRCASSLGIPVRGTLGLVLLAKDRGKIEIARPVVARLLETGMYLSDEIVDQALKLVGE